MIKLKDAKWAIAVEQCLKRLIEAFACHDGHDMIFKYFQEVQIEQRTASLDYC